jgi:hypothetical protein
MKVYVINTTQLTDEEADLSLQNISNDEFISLAKRAGDKYSVCGFENAYNHDEHFDFSNTYIRFIEE